MTENDKGPQKIDLEELLGAEETAGTPSESGEIEILDPVTGDPVRKKGAREGDDANRYEDLYLRTRADFENYRKRIERERVEERSRAAAGLVEELLPVLDSLERALGGTQEGDPFRDGVALIHRQMKDTLARAGLEPIEALGAMFDPIPGDRRHTAGLPVPGSRAQTRPRAGRGGRGAEGRGAGRRDGDVTGILKRRKAGWDVSSASISVRRTAASPS